MCAKGTIASGVIDILEREKIDPNRITFHGFLAAAEYFGLYRQIDIGLDSFPYAGGTTTCDAMWMGVPIITLAGKTAVGRAGVSLLSNVGLTHCIAQTTDQYVNLAAELAGDLPRLAELRKSLRARMRESPLMDGPVFAGGVENAYRQMWRNWCANVLGTGLG